MLLEGKTTLVLEIGGGEKLVELSESCAYVVVPRGTWHTSTRARTVPHAVHHGPVKAPNTGAPKPSPFIPLTAKVDIP